MTAPKKLFDYLDDKLPPDEKERLERALIHDPELQRQLFTARQIHQSIPSDPPDPTEASTARAGRRGRQLAAAFALLVIMNVAIGLFFIFEKTGPPPGYREQKEEALRRQLEKSVQRSAAADLPSPKIGLEQVHLSAPPAQQEKLADEVVAAAQRVGGSGTKELPNEKGINVLVDLPASRAWEFRAALQPLGASFTPPPAGSPASTVRLEVVITTPP